MAKPIHMMVRVARRGALRRFLQQGLRAEGRRPRRLPRLHAHLHARPQNDFEVELTVNKDRAEPYKLGDGYGHLAFVTDDLESERARMTAAGLAPKDIKQMTHDGKPFGKFFFIEDPDGYKIEVLQKGGRFH